MTVEKVQKYQEKVEAADNIIFQMKQIDKVNKEHEEMAIPSLE